MRLLNDTSRRHCGVPINTLDSLSADSLVEMLAPTPRLFASELLYIKAISVTPFKDEQDDLKLKCFRLLASLFEEGPLCEQRSDRLLQLKEDLCSLLTADDLMLCAEFLYQAGEYAHMEDSIFQAVEIATDQRRAMHGTRGMELLEIAANVNEKQLVKALTSSNELMESIQDLANEME